VSADGASRQLPNPFLVVATQNPIEYEGTYPLPEAQLDRFLMKIDVGYPDAGEELRMLTVPRQGLRPVSLEDVAVVAGAAGVRAARAAVDAVSVSDEVAVYLLEVVRRTRDLPSVTLGASPRAAVHLLVAAKAAAALAGRDFVTPDDVAGLAGPVLQHRLVLRPEAELERYDAAGAVRTALESVPVPR
jgi:MoxR-like ATPase